MKVYAVFCSEYDYGNIIGVFSNEEKANEVAKLIDCGAIDGPFELDGFVVPEIPTDKTFFRVHLNTSNPKMTQTSKLEPLDRIGNLETSDLQGYEHRELYSISLWARGKGDAIKLAREKYQEFLLNKEQK